MRNIFSEFKPGTASQWKEQLLKDLKGTLPEDLIWHNENGFDIAPFYTAEDIKEEQHPLFAHSNWDICAKTRQAKSAGEANAQLLKQLNGGATAIAVTVDQPTDIDTLLKDIQLNFIASTFYLKPESLNALIAYFGKHYSLEDLSVSLINTGDTAGDLNAWYQATSALDKFSNIRTTAADALAYHDLNCDAYYEVAIVFSQLIEHLELLTGSRKEPKSPIVRVGVSADYFIQMAKLRAIRKLWHILRKEYDVSTDIYLIVETSLTNKSISDNYNNLLRTTVEAMAAVSGGCNELVVNDFDVLFPVDPSLSQRMSLNQQLILKNESYFDKMADVACGSYFVETITDRLAERAFETFKRFEREGGYFACSASRIFEKEIQAQAQSKEELIKSQKQIAIGVNKFRNEKEKITLTNEQRTFLSTLRINNPVLEFELENYFIR